MKGRFVDDITSPYDKAFTLSAKIIEILNDLPDSTYQSCLDFPDDAVHASKLNHQLGPLVMEKGLKIRVEETLREVIINSSVSLGGVSKVARKGLVDTLLPPQEMDSRSS